MAEIHRDLSVGEVADRSGIRVSAVHFYESQGLILRRGAAAISAGLRAKCCGGLR